MHWMIKRPLRERAFGSAGERSFGGDGWMDGWMDGCSKMSLLRSLDSE